MFETHIVEVKSNHSAQRHGLAASAAMKCLKEFGSRMAFRDNDGNLTNFCLNTKTSEWYVVVTTRFIRNGGYKVAQLITAYKLNDTIENATILMEGQGRTLVNYLIVAGDTYFSVP